MDLLLMNGIERVCLDCGDRRILVPVDDDPCAYCCTSCGAAMLVDPAFDDDARISAHVA